MASRVFKAAQVILQVELRLQTTDLDKAVHFQCVFKYVNMHEKLLGILLKMQIPTQQLWGGAREFAFFTGSQVMLGIVGPQRTL